MENIEIRKAVDAVIKNCFEVNTDTADSITVWECFKAYMRRVFILQMVYRLKNGQWEHEQLKVQLDVGEKTQRKPD